MTRMIVCIERLCYIFQGLLRRTLVFVLLKPMTELSKGRGCVGSSALPAECQAADFIHTACVLRHIFYPGAVISDTCVLVIHLVCLPFHHRVERGFQVNNAGFRVTQQLLALVRAFSFSPRRPPLPAVRFLLLSHPFLLYPPPPPAYSTQLPHQKQLLSLSFPKETLPLFHCLNK